MEELATIRNTAAAELESIREEDVKPDTFETVADVWPEWTIQSRAEFLRRMLDTIDLAPGKAPLAERVKIQVRGSKSGGFLKLYGEDLDHWAAEGIKTTPDSHPEWSDYPQR